MKATVAATSLSLVPFVMSAVITSSNVNVQQMLDEHVKSNIRCDSTTNCYPVHGTGTRGHQEPAPKLETTYHADKDDRALCNFGHSAQETLAHIGATLGSCDSWLEDCKDLQDGLKSFQGYWEVSEWPAIDEWAAFDPLPELKSKCPLYLRSHKPGPMRIGDKDIFYGIEMAAETCRAMDVGSLFTSAICAEHINETDSSDQGGVRIQVRIGGLDE